MTIELTAQDEAWLSAEAARQGLSPDEIVRKILGESRQMPEAVPPPGPVVSAKNAAAIAWLDKRLAEEATNNPEEIRKAQDELDELKRNMNANRTAAGEEHLALRLLRMRPDERSVILAAAAAKAGPLYEADMQRPWEERELTAFSEFDEPIHEP